MAIRAVNITSAAPRLSAWEATSALARRGLHSVMGRRKTLLRCFMSRKAVRRVRSVTWQNISHSVLIDMMGSVRASRRYTPAIEPFVRMLRSDLNIALP